MSRNKELRDSLTVDTLKELIEYRPDTGKFYWKHRPRKYFDTDWRKEHWNRLYANKEAMTSTRDHGYK